MFRRGGSAGTGITSGLDKPRQEYSIGNRVTEGIDPYISDVEKVFQAREVVPNFGGLTPGTLPGFLTSFGLNLASATPTGTGFSGLISTAAGAAKEPFKDFTEAQMTRKRDEADLNRDIINAAIKLKQSDDEAKQSLEKTQMLIDADMAEINQEHLNKIKEIEREADLGTGDSTTYARKQAADAYRATFSPQLQDLDNKIKSTEDVELKKQYEDEKKGVLNKIIRGEQAIYLGQKTDTEFNREVILKMLQGFSTAGELEDQEDVTAAFAAIASVFPNYKEILGPDFQLPGQAMAEGGRAGYSIGSERAVGSEPAMKPVTDVQQDAQVQELTFTELRSRLPSSISDDVVTVLAASKAALTAFANIRDQQDVDQFNQRYNVNLTLPQEG
jgi:hypothetical protein